MNTVCVHDGSELLAALLDASDGGTHADADNVLHLAQGTFTSNPISTHHVRFQYFSSAATGSLTLDGGWDSDCVTQTLDATLSVVDGAHADRALELVRLNGAIYVRWLTVQNGFLDGGTGAGLAINPGIYDPFSQHGGSVGVYDVIVRDNHASGEAGGLFIGAAKAGNWLELEDMLVVDNTADQGYAAGKVFTKGVSASLVNDTISRNTTIAPAGNGGLSVNVDNDGQFDLFNTILWDNGNASLWFDAPNADLEYDDIDVMTAANAVPPVQVGNLAVDPQFVDAGAGDFHLAGSTPLQKIASAGDRATIIDLDGHAVPATGNFDIGAYQLTLFASGFDQ